MKTFLVAAGSAAFAFCLLAAPAWSQATGATTVKERQEHMKAMGGAMKKIAAYVKKEGGTIQDVQAASAVIRDRSKADLAVMFPAGTAVGVADSAAKPEIWQQWPQFLEAAGKIQPAAVALAEAAQAGADADIAQKFQAVGKTCGGCHDSFRQKKD